VPYKAPENENNTLKVRNRPEPPNGGSSLRNGTRKAIAGRWDSLCRARFQPCRNAPRSERLQPLAVYAQFARKSLALGAYFAGLGVAGFRILCVNSFSSDQTQIDSGISTPVFIFSVRWGVTIGLV
jgi:hypothetical protein